MKKMHKSIKNKFQQHEKHLQRWTTFHTIENKTFEMLHVAQWCSQPKILGG